MRTTGSPGFSSAHKSRRSAHFEDDGGEQALVAIHGGAGQRETFRRQRRAAVLDGQAIRNSMLSRVELRSLRHFGECARGYDPSAFVTRQR
jgi:hypothetical protein